MNRFIQIAVEEESTAVKKETEQEVVLYCKIGNPQGLSEAYAVEWHEQAEIKTDIGRIRIRKTTIKGNQPTYELTTKHQVNHHGVIEMDEATLGITEDVYKQFFSVVPEYMSKIRYKFKIEKIYVSNSEDEKVFEAGDMDYEVDVFHKADGTTSQWCKIDVEVQDLESKIKEAGIDVGQFNLNVKIGHLPFGPTDVVFDNKDGNADRAALLRALYDNEFLIKRTQTEAV